MVTDPTVQVRWIRVTHREMLDAAAGTAVEPQGGRTTFFAAALYVEWAANVIASGLARREYLRPGGNGCASGSRRQVAHEAHL